jgi:hypothetical protein
MEPHAPATFTRLFCGIDLDRCFDRRGKLLWGKDVATSRPSLPRYVKLLGWASCPNDIASEMNFLLLPQFLLMISKFRDRLQTLPKSRLQ